MTHKQDQRVERGQKTRERMLEEGTRLFAQKGFEGLSVRELAGSCDVNPAAVSFHFGGKAGLYEAVMDHVTGVLASLYSRAMEHARNLPGDAPSPLLAQAARDMIETLTRSVLTTRRSQWTALLIQRELISPSPAFERLYEEAIRPVLEAFASVIARASGAGPDDAEARTLAFGIFAMINAYSRSRRTYLRWTGKTDFSPEDVDAIARAVSGLALRGLPGITGGPAL